MSAPAKADVKASSKRLCEILKSKYSVNLKHGHALEVLSLALGFRDWNTLSASTHEKTESPDPADEAERIFSAHSAKLAERKDLWIDIQDEAIHFVWQFTFIESDEIMNAGRDLLDEYGVSWIWDKEDGVNYYELSDPDGRPYGNLDGLIEVLRAQFTERREDQSRRISNSYGLDPGAAVWDGERHFTVSALLGLKGQDWKAVLAAVLEGEFDVDELSPK